MLAAFWVMKWELGIPVLILGGLFTGMTAIDEIAALAAVYVAAIEIYIYKDLKLRDMVRISRNSMALSGAVILIMAVSVSLTNWVIAEQIPDKIFDAVIAMGMSEPWHFLVALNVFLYILGAVMDGFSSILVAVPLLLPLAAKFAISPFHLAMMFLLNLEIAYLSPPLGQNLYVTAFRFNVPMIRLFKVCIDFMIVLTVGLLFIMWVPQLSTFAIQKDIAESRKRSLELGEPPREAWMMECVQEDRNNPLPCTPEDKAKYGTGEDSHTVDALEEQLGVAPAGSARPAGSAEAVDDGDAVDDDLMKEMLGEDAAPAGSAAPGAGPGDPTEDDLLKELLDEAPAGSAAPAR
jgi:hypothetical protein